MRRIVTSYQECVRTPTHVLQTQPSKLDSWPTFSPNRGKLLSKKTAKNNAVCTTFSTGPVPIFLSCKRAFYLQSYF